MNSSQFTSDSTCSTEKKQGRARWMSVLAKSPPAWLQEAAKQFGTLPSYVWLRQPETGLAMVRARTGGSGTQFNLGEMSVTRCSLRLVSGETGMAYIAGRDTAHATRVALFDALMQTSAATSIEASVITPIEGRLQQQQAQLQAQAQATRVEFMTMVRGEDA
ncbi:phosphonate C-P lyase system protein PhnG [Undibacterium sp. SXout7W]|uniref:phosphonate C-P lyase system protein PhnG n=1 Tax=Undibacterium sp. SXout7W TaxID=3413049 RepID=UPI003BF01602